MPVFHVLAPQKKEKRERKKRKKENLIAPKAFFSSFNLGFILRHFTSSHSVFTC